jgi:hypothetical protein
VAFWAAVAAAVFLLGGGVSSVQALIRGGDGVAFALLSISVLGLLVALLVAGRIVFVATRIQRRARRG